MPEQPGVVLVGPRPRGVEEEGLTRDVGHRREPLVVDAEVDGVDADGVQAESLDDARLHPFADHDHAVGSPCRAVVGEPSEQALAPRKEPGQVEVLHIEQRQHRREVEAWKRNGQRVVDDAGTVEG